MNLVFEKEEIGNIGNHKESVVNFFNSIGFYEYNIVEEQPNSQYDKHYCVLIFGENPSSFISETDFFEKSKIYQLYKIGYNIKFIFANFVECGIEDGVDLFLNKLDELKISPSDVLLVTENLKIRNLKYSTKTQSACFTPSNIAGTMISLISPEDVEFNINKNYLFQCHNNVNKYHRYGILSMMESNNLLKKADWSLLNTQNFFPTEDPSGCFLNHVFGYDFSERYFTSFQNILNNGNPKYSIYEGEYIRDFQNANGEPSHTITYKENPYKNAYVNIITESQYELQNTVHITEKSIIPFYFLQIPIFVSTPGFVKMFRECFDFDLFDDIIDHSYDNETDNVKRIYKIKDELVKLSENEKFIRTFYVENKERFLSNQNKVVNLSKDFSKIQSIFSECII